jgi:hypothetical protein
VIIPPRPEWQADAACRGVSPSLFVDGTPAKAKRYCQICPVVVECFDEAMANPQLLGVWGGTTTRERHIKRIRRKTA